MTSFTKRQLMNSNEMKELIKNIGNTPVYKIDFLKDDKVRSVYAKYESLNITGSAKDRMALNIILKAYERGELKKGATIVEATSGNTGIAVAYIGKMLGHDVTIFMPDWLSVERKKLIQSYGAKIVLVSKEQGGFLGSIKMAEDLANELENSFLVNQFSNPDNVEAHYKSTAPELYKQVGHIDAFVAGVGTGGTIMGVGKYLREQNPDVLLHPLEPANSPTLSTGHKVGSHRIEGISDEFIPAIVDLKFLNSVISVDDGDAILMAQNLRNHLKIDVGISSGANFIGAVMAQEDLCSDCVVATIFTDDHQKYLSTDLFKEEFVKDDYITPKIKLLSVTKIL
jgi:cysteine synthase A